MHRFFWFTITREPDLIIPRSLHRGESLETRTLQKTKADDGCNWYLFEIEENGQESNNEKRGTRQTRKQIGMFLPQGATEGARKSLRGVGQRAS
jgi:hypothetical protein